MEPDCLIIGGGVIGLSLAWELAQVGAKVRLIDKGQIGEEASWAGAGMLPPGSCQPEATSLDRLQFHSCKYHAQWSPRLQELTGINNGYRPCGAIYLHHHDSADVSLQEQFETWQKLRIEAEILTSETIQQLEPVLDSGWGSDHLGQPSACFVPSEAQIRNPRHLKALHAACLKAGVEITPGVAAEDFQIYGERITGIIANGERISAGQVCITSGSWSAALTRRIGICINIKPVRGQIALLEAPNCRLQRIINVGSRYLVPRGDGLILIGSTMEDVGFDRRTTVEGIRGLLEFACEILPELNSAKLVRSWAGLRPASADDLPCMGRLPDLENAFLSTGHFRAGLTLSAASAVSMRQLMQGEQTEVGLSDFDVDRFQHSSAV